MHGDMLRWCRYMIECGLIMVYATISPIAAKYIPPPPPLNPSHPPYPLPDQLPNPLLSPSCSPFVFSKLRSQDCEPRASTDPYHRRGETTEDLQSRAVELHTLALKLTSGSQYAELCTDFFGMRLSLAVRSSEARSRAASGASEASGTPASTQADGSDTGSDMVGEGEEGAATVDDYLALPWQPLLGLGIILSK